jgi:hypothetical protein
MKYSFDLNDKDRLLARRQHILTSAANFVDFPVDSAGNFTPFIPANNERYEHDKFSLSQWETINTTVYDSNNILNNCFDFPPLVNMNEPNSFHKLMCQGVGTFSIQWAYWEPAFKRFLWFPSENPDGDVTTSDSHFDLVKADGIPALPGSGHGYVDFDTFGAFFNIPNSWQINYWAPPDLLRYNATAKFPLGFYPKVLKFTFTLYDSKNVLKAGQTFTHIVYLD